MALIEYNLFGSRINKVDLAIKRIREFEQLFFEK